MTKIIRTVLAMCLLATMVCTFGACKNNKTENAVDTAKTNVAQSVDEVKDKAASKKAETKKADAKKTDKAKSSTKEDEAVNNDDMEYMSPDGWRVCYNAKTIESSEIDKHSAQFVYTGKSAGTNMVTISYIADKQPEEVLYDVTSQWTKDDAKIKRSEGFFPGTSDKWGYWRELPAAKNGSGLGMTAIAGEYNGGVLLFEVTSHMSGKEEIDMAVSDTLSGVIDSITYFKGFKDQTMYSYYPGTYKATGKDAKYASVTLKKDHTGVLTDAKGKKTRVTWGSTTLTPETGKGIQFDIEGDNLYLELGNDWVEYSK